MTRSSRGLTFIHVRVRTYTRACGVCVSSSVSCRVRSTVFAEVRARTFDFSSPRTLRAASTPRAARPCIETPWAVCLPACRAIASASRAKVYDVRSGGCRGVSVVVSKNYRPSTSCRSLTGEPETAAPVFTASSDLSVSHLL